MEHLINKSQLNIQRSLIDKMIDSYLSDGSNTRSETAKRCNVSLSTSGKVANTLVSLGLFDEKLQASSRMGRRCRHLFIKNSVDTVVIDMSSPEFSLSLICGADIYRYGKTYKYDPSLDFEANLTVFLSRTCIGMPINKKAIINFCIIHSDAPHIASVQAYLPDISDKHRISDILKRTIGKTPLLFISRKDAFASAISYGILNTQDCSVSYIFADSPLLSYNFSRGNSSVCNLSNLLINGQPAQKLYDNIFSKEESELLLTHLINFADTAFVSDMIMIESNSISIDDPLLNSVRRDLALAGISVPILKVCTKDPGICILGAARATVSQFIKHLI